jgi:two-component system, NarL family, response regulator NreC
MIRVLIADDHAVVRAGLRSLIREEASLKLVGEATGGLEVLSLAESLDPDVILLDISMPDMDGITVTRKIHQTKPSVHILVLTVHEDDGLLREAIQAGASGYILKRAAEAELISAINVVLRGDLYIDPAMMRSLLVDRDPVKQPDARRDPESLTPREEEVLKLIVQGYTNRQIAEELSISIRTVEGHRSNLSEKLGLHSRVDLVRYAREHELIQ